MSGIPILNKFLWKLTKLIFELAKMLSGLYRHWETPDVIHFMGKLAETKQTKNYAIKW